MISSISEVPVRTGFACRDGVGRRGASLLAGAAVFLTFLTGGIFAADPSAGPMADALRSDAISIPSPGELMSALAKEGKPAWQNYFRKPVPSNFTSRPQIALNLGALIADGYIAVEAEDPQQVKNIGKEIIELARTLGVSESVIGRGNSIIEFAENSEWETLREELEATQNEVKLAMAEKRDDSLISLVTLGGWIRGTEVVTSWISENYTEGSAKLLRQPAIVSYLRLKVEALPDRIREDRSVELVMKRLGEMERLVSFAPEEVPTPEKVRALRDMSAELVSELSTAKK